MEQIDNFKTIVETVMSNWTGLKLAVDHSPNPIMWRQNTLDLIENIAYYFNKEGTSSNAFDLEDYLTEILDTDFNTIFEDDSPRLIAVTLIKFYQLWISGNMIEFHKEFSKHPKADLSWLTIPKVIPLTRIQEESNMDTDDDGGGWTTVKRKNH